MIRIKIDLSEDERDLLICALGGFQIAGAQHLGWCNQLQASEDHAKSLKRLESAGLMSSTPSEDGSPSTYKVTRKGCDLLGMPAHRSDLALSH